MMKYCVAANMVGSPTTPVPLSGDFCEQMRKAHKMGYDAIEIHVPDVSVLDVPTIRACMQETSMEVATLGTGTIYGRYGLHLCDEDEQRQQELFERVCAFIDCAAQLNARVTIGSIKGNIRPNQDRDKHLDILGKALKRIDDYAGRKNVVVLLEATNRYENNVLNTGAQLADMIHSYALEHTRALMDAFHMNIEEAQGTRGCWMCAMSWGISILRITTACIRAEDALIFGRWRRVFAKSITTACCRLNACLFRMEMKLQDAQVLSYIHF